MTIIKKSPQKSSSGYSPLSLKMMGTLLRYDYSDVIFRFLATKRYRVANGRGKGTT
jgi:hypothetical protein